MWTPVPAAEPGTDLRRVAALLLETGLPGVPVIDEAGRIVGFVSRTDLLRALATDPPLDLWA
jgi:CBS domain-containing protein